MRTFPYNRTRAASAFTLVEMLLALSITAVLMTAVAFALDASFMAYANTAEQASIDVAGRQSMQRMTAMIRSGKLHDAYDPADPAVTLLQPSFAPLNCIGIQMFTRDEQLVRIWWVENAAYGVRFLGDLWYQQGAEDPQIMLSRVEAQVANDQPYIFTLASRNSDQGLLLLLASIDMTVRPDPASALSTERKGPGTSIRLVGSTRPRMNLE